MIYENVQALLDYAKEKQLITAEDEICARNMLLDALHLTSWEQPESVAEYASVDEILDKITDYAAENGIIESSAAYCDLFDTKIMGLLTAMPREVNARFAEEYKKSPEAATDWYFDYSKNTNYVRAGRIAKDIRWEYPCEYGTLDITINCSKPEKDPRDIAAARNQPKAKYPACQLCIENTGFAGTLTHPARQNLRPVPLKVGGGDWFFQYSPYGYYNEHCIVFNGSHIPMKIDKAVFGKLFDIIDALPHYFVGSNADLPIVGGSILAHEHFQGGRYTFTMEKAPAEHSFKMKGFDGVKAATVKWPMSVIRLSGADREQLSLACDEILRAWRAYSDEAVGIFAETDGVPHNTITPIARKRNGEYECDLVLRNNITTEDRPLGVFHPNPTLHHIKKENIGLIEVMGLAVLPARLKGEMEKLADMLVNKGVSAVRLDSELEKHADWAEEFAARYDITADNVRDIINTEVGRVFMQVLLDAGVFKRDEKGQQAFLRFTEKFQ